MGEEHFISTKTQKMCREAARAQRGGKSSVMTRREVDGEKEIKKFGQSEEMGRAK